jgi:hypothetical protein
LVERWALVPEDRGSNPRGSVVIENRIKVGTAKLCRTYRAWSVWMSGTVLPRFIIEGSWCFLGEAQRLTEKLNRMSEAEVNDFVDRDLREYLKKRMVRGLGKKKYDRIYRL